MAFVAFSIVCITSFAVLCGAALTPQEPNPPPISEGASCSPPFGFEPIGCEFGQLLNSTEEVLPPDRFGINVCRITRLFLVNDTAYTYQRRCGFILNQGSKSYFQQCFLDCLPLRQGNRCTNSTHIESRISMQCCPGTSPRKSDLVLDQEREALSISYLPLDVSPPGCAVARGPTLLDCLMQQRLTDFIQVIMTAGLTDFINSTTPNITLFAPVNGMVPTNLSPAQAMEFVRSHIVSRTVNGSELMCGLRLEALTENFLHIGSLEHIHRRLAIRNNPWDPVNPAFRENLVVNTQRFVNGREITTTDACDSEFFQRLHLVTGPIPVSNQSIFVLLQTVSNLSNFLQLVNDLGLGPSLSLPRPHTVLAPSNEAFTAAGYPIVLLECLQLRERRALTNLVLYHMSDTVEFTSSLANRNFLYTQLLNFLTVDMMDGRPILGSERASITMPDITAENGVLHIIDKVLIPPGFSLGSCESLTPAPPTMPDPMTTAIDPTATATTPDLSSEDSSPDESLDSNPVASSESHSSHDSSTSSVLQVEVMTSMADMIATSTTLLPVSTILPPSEGGESRDPPEGGARGG